MKQVVIMPGGFHPFHAGHYALYQQAQQAFPGADVYVAATNDTSARPFPFAVKEKLAKLAGVAPGRFVQVKSPFQAREITADLDPENTQLIFVRSEKDADKPPQAGGTKKDGNPAYLQLYKDAAELKPMNQHAYMAYLPTVEFGPGMTSATEIRTAWPTLDERRKTALVMSLYPRTQKNPQLAATVVKMLDAAIGGQDIAEGYSNTTFQTERKRLNVPALIKAGALFVTYPHGEQGWETDNQEDWAYSLISLYNVMQGGWSGEAKKYLKPASYKKAEQQINSSAPNLGSDKLVYDGKYNQILWSIKKLGIPDNVAFLDNGKQGVAEGVVVPFRRPQLAQLTWQQLPKDVLKLANDWYWASEDDSGLDAVLDPKGFGSGTRNELQYITAKLQQRGWTIDFNDEHDGPGEFNLILKNKNGQSILLPIEDAQDFKGWAQGTNPINEEQNPRIDLTPNYPNYETLIGEFVGAKNNRLLFKIVAAELKPAVSATEKITNAMATGKLISIELSRVKNRKVIPEVDDQYRPPGISAAQARDLMTKIRGSQPFVWKRPNQISGSHAESELLALGFKKSKYNTWGGTQAMWDRLAGIPESADYIEEKISR